MELETLTQTIINALEDVKARDIKVFNTEELTDQFECVVIASGTSGRQTRALAYAVSHAVKEAGGSVIGMEGDDTGEWGTAVRLFVTCCSLMFATITTLKKSGAARSFSSRLRRNALRI